MTPANPLCVFGSSIAYGVYDYEKGGWVNRLRLFFDNKETDIEIYNLGITGETTEGLLRRFDIEAQVREPGVVIIDIGINDAVYIKGESRYQVSPELFERNLETLVEKAKKVSTIVFLKLPTNVDETRTDPIPWRPEFSYLNLNIDTYAEIIKKVGERSGVKCIKPPVLMANDLSDGIHPTTEGHEKIFQAVKEFLEKEIFFLLNS